VDVKGLAIAENRIEALCLEAVYFPCHVDAVVGHAFEKTAPKGYGVGGIEAPVGIEQRLRVTYPRFLGRLVKQNG
jgi:hypothetical protein